MIVQINTDKTLRGEGRMQEYFDALVKESLERYQSEITRIEVHLKDENGIKEGVNDMSCVLEARLKGEQPIAVTNRADTMELAFTGAITKIENALKSILDKKKSH